MESYSIIVDPPGFDETAFFMQWPEDMLVEAFIAKTPVKGLDEGILNGLSGGR